MANTVQPARMLKLATVSSSWMSWSIDPYLRSADDILFTINTTFQYQT
jgi:hypothetical protein